MLLNKVLRRRGRRHRLDDFLIAHLAAADLLTLATMCLPKLVTGTARAWVLGPALCAVFATTRMVPFLVEQVCSCIKLHIIVRRKLGVYTSSDVQHN